jgi:hypothetical protein
LDYQHIEYLQISADTLNDIEASIMDEEEELRALEMENGRIEKMLNAR